MLRLKNISTHTDEELLQLHRKSGHAEYFGELYNRYIPLIYGVCLKYLRDEDKAQDAVMQLFENLHLKIAGYEIDVFRTWLYSVVKNHCLQILRKENKEIIVDFNTEIMESDEVLHLLCEEENDQEKTVALRRCLEKLPEQQRVSIIHFFMKEMSYADIVDKTGFSLKAVKSYIQNGKRNLKLCIDKHSK
ncbi:RNA polymerase sigma factor [Bacteroides sp. 224]|uniref:RNA polymerase sigma factor n=1 Tax=Bacteroides sp. 224 TaxID=2302936 RepID=UPI0013D44667|nr:sigma-70 family RNA polymerase sigma factor [Bacteroides sp. 224]NDV64780.1 sigma-70 family RNA polymerase sigma factor [Bacteroides sp. 224]